MKLSIELFLFDNVMMNFLILRLAATMTGMRAKLWRALSASVFGAVYALLSMSALPALSELWPKIALCLLMALPLIERGRDMLRAVLCLLLSACMMGGVMFGLTMLFGGSFSGGAYICTVPVRIFLLAAFLCALLPRGCLAMRHALASRCGRVRIRVRFSDRLIELNALIDSGNLVVEPISGLPVVIVRPGLLPELPGRPVPFRTVSGEGVLNALRPTDAFVYRADWRRLNIWLAEAVVEFRAADAIVGSMALTEERWEQHATEPQGHDSAAVPVDPAAHGDGAALYALGRDASAAVCSGGGAAMDCTSLGGGAGSQECAD